MYKCLHHRQQYRTRIRSPRLSLSYVLICFARNSAIVSIGSIPAFSARATGIESSASANFWTASCALPSRLLDHLLNSLAMYASVAPPLLLQLPRRHELKPQRFC